MNLRQIWHMGAFDDRVERNSCDNTDWSDGGWQGRVVYNVITHLVTRTICPPAAPVTPAFLSQLRHAIVFNWSSLSINSKPFKSISDFSLWPWSCDQLLSYFEGLPASCQQICVFVCLLISLRLPMEVSDSVIVEVSSWIKCTRARLPPALPANKSPSLSPTLQQPNNCVPAEYSVFIRRTQASRESVEFGQRPWWGEWYTLSVTASN